jgi:hypothetical protein
MQQLFSEYFDNSSADVEKQAQVELFAKLAADNGIDLEQLSEGQIAHLWNETFKTAEEESKADDMEEKVERAKKEHAEKKEEKKEAAAKLAEAEYLGRFMAHAMVDEIQKLAASPPSSAVSGVPTGPLSSGAKTGPLSSKAKLPTAAKAGLAAAALAGTAYGGKKLYDRMKKKKDEPDSEEKQSSAIDELAAQLAVEKAASAGWDAEEAVARVSSVLTLGVGESEKVASAADLESAVDVRSLEFLEAAGYPVTWNA